MKKKRTGLKIFVIVAIVLVLFFSLINFITDFLWFRELGYVSVFFTKLFTQLKIVVPVFIVVTSPGPACPFGAATSSRAPP